MSEHVLWTDVAPRDGLQNVAETVATETKLRLIEGLLAAGVPRVEATAFVSPQWVPQLADAAAVMQALDRTALSQLRVLIPNVRGLERALEHDVRNVLVTVGATESFNRRNVNRSVAESLEELTEIVRLAQQHHCKVDVALSVSFGCPFEGWVDPARVVEICAEIAGRNVAEIGLADTIGVATPRAVSDLVARVHEALPGALLSLHMHDTRGLGVANVVAGYQAGVRRFDGSVGGVGGCPFAPRSTGNVCSEDALQALQSLGARIDADVTALVGVAETLAHDLGQQLPGKTYRAGVWMGKLRTKPEEQAVG